MFFNRKKENAGGISEQARRLIEMLDCPCEHFPEGGSPERIINAYNDVFAKHEMGGYTPLIIVVDDTLLEVIEEFAKTPEELKANRERLLNTPQLDAQKWFTERLGALKEDMGEYWEQQVGEVVCEQGDVMKTFSGIASFITRKSEECVLARIPAADPWEVFARLPFGGWNEVPNPEEILWISKYWYERYGVIPAVMTRDILEFSARPIKDKNTALGAALEQFAFCQDIVFQGVETIGRLAGALMQSSVWYFWWD
ncbi:MAG: DUF4253 domain-containing protein [Lachnospiraceae bacterium]|nr:DUF4253 domain-containing protein [Ruminococcus sp.]MCM1275026.1 DUF4253 domain-containing protein [Lachnospiraceae bacterium]